MGKSELSIDALIQQARSDRDAVGRLLESYRPLLLLQAQAQLAARLTARVEAADVVQQTFADAVRAFADFAGATEPEFSAWIRRIHERNLVDVVRQHIQAEKQSVDREQPADAFDGSASLVWLEPAVDSSTPSRKMIRAERALRLAAMLQSLPDMQREAVRLRHLEGWTLLTISQQLGRSPAATAGLIKRGLHSLRERMSEESWGSSSGQAALLGMGRWRLPRIPRPVSPPVASLILEAR